MIAPLSFIFKAIKAPVLEGVHLHGDPNAGKSSSGEIGLAFDGNECDENFNLYQGHIDTNARFGDTISNTTFPKLVNEVDLNDPRNFGIVTNIIMAIDAVRFRKTVTKDPCGVTCISLTLFW